jgi:histone H3
MDSAQVSILKKTNEVGLRRLLKGKDGRGLEAKIGLEVLSNLTDKALEGRLANEQLGRLLVFTNLTEGDGSGTVTVGLLHTSGGGCRLTGSLENEDNEEKGSNSPRG